MPSHFLGIIFRAAAPSVRANTSEGLYSSIEFRTKPRQKSDPPSLSLSHIDTYLALATTDQKSHHFIMPLRPSHSPNPLQPKLLFGRRGSAVYPVHQQGPCLVSGGVGTLYRVLRSSVPCPARRSTSGGLEEGMLHLVAASTKNFISPQI